MNGRADLHSGDASVTRFVELLHRSIGLDAASIGSNTIERAVRERFAAWRGHEQPNATLDDYWHALIHLPERMQDLIEAVVVPETWFFRDAEAFSALVRMARARLAARPAEPLRVLSLPCSSGEEAYSAAMALLDANIAPEQFSIDALDVSERALARARHAHYGRNAFRGHALAYRERHFSKAKDGWRLDPRVASRVRFTQANLLKVSSLAYPPFDFIFCRNVLIYFDRDTQRDALRVLDGLLAEGGTLFVGPAETGLLMREGMTSAKIPLAFAFHRASDKPHSVKDTNGAQRPNANGSTGRHWPQALHGARPSASGPLARVPGTTESLARRRLRSPQAHDAIPFAAHLPSTLAHPARTGPQHTQHAPHAPHAPHAQHAQHAQHAPSAPTLERAHALADGGELGAAAIAAQAFLDANPSSADAYYLLGVIADASAEPAAARAHYKRALYLSPAHREALTHLAALLELDGDPAGARLLLARAERLTQGDRHE